MVPHERNWREFAPEQPHPDIPYQCASVPFTARGHHWQAPGCENGKTSIPLGAEGWKGGHTATQKNCRVRVSHSRLSVALTKVPIQEHGASFGGDPHPPLPSPLHLLPV